MLMRNQPTRFESSTLAAALAAAGTLFMSDRLSVLAPLSSLSPQVVWPAAGIVLVATGVCLLVEEWPS